MLVAFLRFLSVFGTFSQKVVENWFVSHETGHTTLFGLCYCVEMVRIENNSHMLEITCYVAFLYFFKHYWHFLAKSGVNLVCLPRKLAHEAIWYNLLF